jgi:hypothetical protein
VIRLLSVLLSLPVPGLVAATPVNATSGALDDNTCHCHDHGGENPDQEAPVEKSRANVRHERASPNYKHLKRCCCPTLGTCQKSGGRRRGS